MKAEILKLLKDSDGYISGQDICEKFGVSRTAVWKVMRQLGEEGYRIEAVRNKGYHLIDCEDVMNQAELESVLKGGFCKSVKYYDVVDSTNNRAKQLAEAGAPHGTLVVSDCQTAGKGRRGRSWVSAAGEGIWMSLILRPDVLPSSASMLTLVAALAVYDGILETSGLNTGIKWPNDIVADGKKVCGILTEMSAELEGIHYVVVGIGINANIEAFPEEVRDMAASIYQQTGEKVRRGQMIAAVMNAMERYYDSFLSCGNLSELVNIYDSRLVNQNTEVRVLDPAGEYTGKALGIDEDGGLLVELNNREVKHVVSGEVSVRGIYGYV